MKASKHGSAPRISRNARLIAAWRLWKGRTGGGQLLLAYQPLIPPGEVERRRSVFQIAGVAGPHPGVFSFPDGKPMHTGG